MPTEVLYAPPTPSCRRRPGKDRKGIATKVGDADEERNDRGAHEPHHTRLEGLDPLNVRDLRLDLLLVQVVVFLHARPGARGCARVCVCVCVCDGRRMDPPSCACRGSF